MRLLVTFYVLLMAAACQSQAPATIAPPGVTRQVVAPGYLQGHVNIGPLLPVERVGVPSPTVRPEVYAARTIVILQRDGKTEVLRVKPDDHGNYRVELAPGQYVVDLARVGIDRAKGLPATVTIESGRTTTLDIEVDTGIR